jgi:hypothetical protein
MQLLIAIGLLLLLFQSFSSAGVVLGGLPGGGSRDSTYQPNHPQPRAAQDPGPGLPGLTLRWWGPGPQAPNSQAPGPGLLGSTLPSSILGPMDNGQLGCTYCGSSDGSPALVSL